MFDPATRKLAIDSACGTRTSRTGCSLVYPSPVSSNSAPSSMRATSRTMQSPSSRLSASPRMPACFDQRVWLPQARPNFESTNRTSAHATSSPHQQALLALSPEASWTPSAETTFSYMGAAAGSITYAGQTPPPVHFPSRTDLASMEHNQAYHGTLIRASTGTCSPMPLTRQASPSRMSSEAVSSVENNFYDMEPCHLALSSADDHATPGFFDLTSASPPYSFGQNLERKRSSPLIKQEISDSGSMEHNSDEAEISSSEIDDFDFNEFIKLESPEPRRKGRSSEIPKFFCPFCAKPFSRTFNYNTHIQTHDPSRPRPYPCPLPHCDKSFFRPTDLKRHDQSVHQKSKAFACSMCGAGFPRKDSLQRHVADGCARRSRVRKAKNKRRLLLNKVIRDVSTSSQHRCPEAGKPGSTSLQEQHGEPEETYAVQGDPRMSLPWLRNEASPFEELE